MKKLFLAFITLAVFAFVFVSCKKYEEGPTISLASKKSRVANTWTIEKMIVNGNDVTSTSQTYIAGFSVELTKDYTYTRTADGYTETGTWDFDSEKENIITTPSSVLGIVVTSKILKLKNKELWIKYTIGSTTTELHLK
jgi:hypothetical protein